MVKTNEMATKSIPKLLLKFSLPAIIALLVNALYNIIDSMFVGKGVGDLALAGVTVVFPVITLYIAFIMLIAMGATALISINLGKGKKDEAEKILGNATVALVFSGIVLTIIGLIVLEPMLILFGATENVLPYAMKYAKIILIGSTFLAIGTGLNSFIRAEGNSKVAMISMLIGAITNIALDYVFIFIFKWGTNGAALATVISYAATSTYVFFYFFSKRSVLKLRLTNLKIDNKLMSEMMKLGFPTFVIQATGSIQQIILNKTLGSLGGDNALTSIGIIMSLMSFITMPAMGIGQGAQPIFGYNRGANLDDRVKETLIYSLVSATIAISLGFLVVQIWPTAIFKMFTDVPSVIDLGVGAMRTFFMFIPLVGVQMIGSNYFQATGKSKSATALALSRQVLIFIPLLIIMPLIWGLKGVWWTAPISDIGAFILTGTWLIVSFRKEAKISAKDKLEQEAFSTT